MLSRVKVATRVIAFFLLSVHSVSHLAFAACSRDQFRNRVTLDSSIEYTLDYRIDSEASQLIIALRAKTTGWLGLGFSESGHLIGSDFVGVAVIQGKPQVTDRFIEWDAFPSNDSSKVPKEDKCNNWKVLCSNEENGYTEFVLSRAVDTRDSEDRPIVPGDMPIVFAWDGSDNFFDSGYLHGSTIINFYASTEAAFRAPSDANGYTDVIIGNFQMFDEPTQYVLQKFDLGTTPKHIVAIEPTIHPDDAPFIDYIIVHDCGAKGKERPLMFMPNNMPINAGKISPLGLGSCNGVIAAWGRGSQSIVFPELAGYRIGDSEARYVVLEVHVDNPTEDSTRTIKSGMRLHTTTRLRQKNIGAILLGDSQAQFPALSGGVSRTHYESTCPSECLSRFFGGGGGDITVVHSFPHMHSFGKEIFTVKYEKDGTSSLISKRQYWNNDFQYQSGNLSVKLKPTDRLSTHCVYDTSKSNSRIRFGGGSNDEMCMEFLMYYPKKVDGLLCGYRNPTSTLCLVDQQVQGPNPQPDGLEGIPASVSIGEAPKACEVDPTAVPAPVTTSPSTVATLRPTSGTSSPVSQPSLNPTALRESTLAPSLERSVDTRAPSIESTTATTPIPTATTEPPPSAAPPTSAQTDETETNPPSKNLASDQTSLSMSVALILYVACVVTMF